MDGETQRNHRFDKLVPFYSLISSHKVQKSKFEQ